MTPNCRLQSTDPVCHSRYDCLQAKLKGAVTNHSFDLMKEEIQQAEAGIHNTDAVPPLLAKVAKVPHHASSANSFPVTSISPNNQC